MRTIIILGFAFIIGSFYAYAQDDEQDPSAPTGPPRTISMIKVSDSIFMFKGKGGNIGVCKGEDGVLLIDNQFAAVTPEILRLVSSISDKPVQFLVNTHHHGDHTGGNINMLNAGTVIYAHDNVRQRLLNADKRKFMEEQEAGFTKMVKELEASGNDAKAQEKVKEGNKAVPDFVPPKNTYPTITFSEDLTFHYNGEEIMVFHVHNAHTDGDVMVYFTESNVLHTGDVFFNGKYPFVDIKSGGTYNGYIDALSKALMLIDDETKIIPGHGDLGTKADMTFSRNMMVSLRDRVAFQYLSKKSKEEILAMKEITTEFDAKGFGDGFISTEKFIELIYDQTQRKYGKVKK